MEVNKKVVDEIMKLPELSYMCDELEKLEGIKGDQL